MLTKSDLQSFLQCPRKLWLEKHRPDAAAGDVTATARRAMDGMIVGDKAREQLGRGFIWPPGGADKSEAAAVATRLLTESPNSPAAEVPLVREGLYARADSLIPERGRYTLRETKAATFPLKKDKLTPDTPDQHQLDDIAIQAWVMDGSGLPRGRNELNLLDSRWRYPGDGDYRGLFRQLDVTNEIAERLAEVPGWLGSANAVVAAEMPEATTGRQCKEPYGCQFFDYCFGLQPPGPEHPIELLPDSAGKNLARKLRAERGFGSILEPAPADLTGGQAELYRRIQLAHRTGQAVRAPGAEAAIDALGYPRYYFDFEGIDLPVPRWRGVRPYEHIPFQWSCHIERQPGRFDHAEFLDLSGDDPSLGCIRAMSGVIDADEGGPIIVYFATYERCRLQELAERHPEHAGLMDRYISRLVDLHPLLKQHFYHPAMEGSFSIKKVLPVVAPDLDYEALEEVREGTGAQIAYIEAALDQATSRERKHELEQRLRAYCRQDTWAMVEIAYFLTQRDRPVRTAGM